MTYPAFEETEGAANYILSSQRLSGGYSERVLVYALG